MKSGMSSFFTRERANEGVVLPLSTPTGEDTEHWIKIRGVDSDAFKSAKAESERRMYALAFAINSKTKDEKDQYDQAAKEEVIKVQSSLVIAWSFDEPCTHENIVKFLKEAPQIADQIDRLANRRALFFGNSLKPSTPSPATTSSSPSPSTEPTPASAIT